MDSLTEEMYKELKKYNAPDVIVLGVLEGIGLNNEELNKEGNKIDT